MNCLLVVLAICLHSCLAQRNILRNGGFESKLQNNQPTDWCENQCCTCMRLQTVNSPRRSGQYALLVADRTRQWAGPSQVIGGGHANKVYKVSAWLKQSSSGSQEIEAMVNFKGQNGIDEYYTVGVATLTDARWILLQDTYSFPAYATGAVRFYLQAKYPSSPPYTSFYVDDVTMVQVPGPSGTIIHGDWRDKANADINKHRKRTISLIIPNQEKLTVEIKQTKHSFAFGTAVSPQLISNNKYRDIFFENFNWAVLENALKWPSNEPQMYNVGYETAEKIIKILESRSIPIRGHTIFWGVPQFVQGWLKGLTQQQLWDAMGRRVSQVVSKFKGRLVHWDVNNEMLHGRFYRDATGNPYTPAWMFKQARRFDQNVKLFLNDYNIITPPFEIEPYKQMARDLINQGADLYGLGLQSHWGRGTNPDYSKLMGHLWRLSEVGKSLWLTELDVQEGDENKRADKLETVVRTAFSHQAVDGILLWGFWANAHWRKSEAALWASDWRVTEAGKRWQSMMREWTTNVKLQKSQLKKLRKNSLEATFRAFHGTYDIYINGKKIKSFTVEKGAGTQRITL